MSKPEGSKHRAHQCSRMVSWILMRCRSTLSIDVVDKSTVSRQHIVMMKICKYFDYFFLSSWRIPKNSAKYSMCNGNNLRSLYPWSMLKLNLCIDIYVLLMIKCVTDVGWSVVDGRCTEMWFSFSDSFPRIMRFEAVLSETKIIRKTHKTPFIIFIFIYGEPDDDERW